MKRYIKSESSIHDRYAEIPIYFKVYEIDEDGEELDPIDSFDTLEEAIEFAKTCDFYTHICFIPGMDPDDDPGYSEYLEYTYDYEPYEIIWSSI